LPLNVQMDAPSSCDTPPLACNSRHTSLETAVHDAML
jgi:hypothetical protein